LRVKELQRRAAGSGYEAVTAQRLLNTVFTDTSFYLMREFLQQNRYEHATAVLEVAALINDDSPLVWYNLACAQARSRRRGEALDSLERAIEAGFNNVDHIQSDPDLESLRGKQRYQELVESLRR
jgi:tetratricopeptide (TPR) repeat protein